MEELYRQFLRGQAGLAGEGFRQRAGFLELGDQAGVDRIEGGIAGNRRRRLRAKAVEREDAFELLQHVVRRFDEFGALADELVAAAGVRARYRAGQGEDFAVLLQGEFGGDEGAALQARLDHHGSGAQAADDAVAAGEMIPGRRRGQRELRNERALGENLPAQFAIARGIADIDPGAHYRHRASAGGKRALVGRGIDAERHAGADRQPRGAQFMGQPLGVAAAVGAAAAAAHHGDGRFRQTFGLAFHIQHRRRRGDFAQRERIARRFEMHNVPAGRFGPGKLLPQLPAQARLARGPQQDRGLGL